PSSTLLPYTTLFRSEQPDRAIDPPPRRRGRLRGRGGPCARRHRRGVSRVREHELSGPPPPSRARRAAAHAIEVRLARGCALRRPDRKSTRLNSSHVK